MGMRWLWMAWMASNAWGLPALRLESARVRAEFRASSAPAAVAVHGELKEGAKGTGAFVLVGSQLTGSVGLDLDDFDTGVGLRNSHMKEKYLETAKWPRAELVLGGLTVPEQGDFNLSKVPFDGTLHLHGTAKPVSGTAALLKRDGRLEVTLEFTLPLSAFGVETPSFLGVRLGDGVSIRADAAGSLSELIP